jgi:hypothetical protein
VYGIGDIMQNHTKTRFTHTTANAMAAIAIGAMLVFSVAGMKAFADVVNNDVVVGGNDTITTEGSTTINYKVVGTGGDGQPGCNPADGSKATVTINKPAAVTATPGSLTFSSCNDPQSVVFSSSTPGDYVITVDVSDSGVGTYSENPATFTLHVNAAPAPTNTAPVITVPADITEPATSASGASIQFEVSAEDAEDGDVTDAVVCEDEGGNAVQSGDTFPIGTTTVTCEVEDSGGLTDSDSFDITVTIEAKGFYQPVDNPATVNAGKAGQTYPLKFEVFGDKDDANTEITETSVIQQPLKYKKIDCGTGATLDTLETTASGSTTLRYDSTAGQFIYNWKTPPQKGCYQVDVALIENMGTLTALFNLK